MNTQDLLQRLSQINNELQAAKALYAEQDQVLLQLIALGFKEAPLSDGTHARLVDNFLDKEGAVKNTAWKASGIKRFEIEFLTQEELAKEAAKLQKKSAK